MTSPGDAGFEELDRDACFALLRTQQVGRLGVVVNDYPMVFPVNYALDGTVVVFRTAPGQKLRVGQGGSVTFEVDEIDPVHRSGWSVVVRGTAEEVRDEERRRALTSLVAPWAPGERGSVVRVIPRDVTGRRIRPGALADGLDLRGYL